MTSMRRRQQVFHSHFIAALLRKGYMLSRGSITSLLLVHTDTSLHYTRVTTRDVKSSRSKPTWPRGQNFRPQRHAMLAGLVSRRLSSWPCQSSKSRHLS